MIQMETKQGSPKFKHFIITLFNLKIWKVDKTKKPTQTEDWLEQRFALFEKYCLPSVKCQTVKNFTWLCLFDSETPEKYRRRIEAISKEFPILQPCYVTAEEASHYMDDNEQLRCRFIRENVAKRMDNDAEWVITTNLDNDDAIRKDMVEKLQEVFLQSPRERLVSLNIGYQYFVEKNAVVRMYYPHNHFLTLVERTDKDFCTVEYYGHASARKKLEYIDVFEKPYWMEVVHGHNVSNELRITSRIKYLPRLSTFKFSEFGGDKVLSWTVNLYNFLFRLPVYFCKIAVWRLKKKIGKGRWENA